jgi:hypothetical protein
MPCHIWMEPRPLRGRDFGNPCSPFSICPCSFAMRGCILSDHSIVLCQKLCIFGKVFPDLCSLCVLLFKSSFSLRLCNAMSENSAFLAKFFPIFVSFVFFCKNILIAALPR